MVWGGISFRGTTKLAVAEGHVNSESYQAILQDCLLPQVRELYPDAFILQQDNASPHTSKSTKEWFQLNGVARVSLCCYDYSSSMSNAIRCSVQHSFFQTLVFLTSFNKDTTLTVVAERGYSSSRLTASRRHDQDGGSVRGEADNLHQLCSLEV